MTQQVAWNGKVLWIGQYNISNLLITNKWMNKWQQYSPMAPILRKNEPWLCSLSDVLCLRGLLAEEEVVSFSCVGDPSGTVSGDRTFCSAPCRGLGITLGGRHVSAAYGTNCDTLRRIQVNSMEIN